MQFTFPKNEKLKSKKDIKVLFEKGSYLKCFPIRLVYFCLENREEDFLKVGVSVSKRNFKKAVDRNKVKRLLREAYRLNKHLISCKKSKGYIAMFIYNSNTITSYIEVEQKIVRLLKQLNEKINSST